MQPTDQRSSTRLLSLLYSEMHRLAEQCRAGHPESQAIGSTTLVSEACLTLLSDQHRARLKRKDMLVAAAGEMRRVLVAHACARCDSVSFDSAALDELVVSYDRYAIDLPALDDALQQLSRICPEMARAVELRFFAGLSLEEVAEQLGMPQRTFERQWAAARAWLYDRMT